MLRVMMTGMCTSADRLIVDAGQSELRFNLYPKRVRTKAQVMREFRIAANTGNYLITEGAFHALSECQVTYIPFWHLNKPENSKLLSKCIDEFDVCVFVTANILHTDFKLEAELRFFSRWRKRLVFMSIGLQRLSDLNGVVPAHTRQFMNVLERDEVTTFTRGPLTSEFLRKNGVKNIVDACCPSSFLYPDEVIKSLKRTKDMAADSFDEIWINGYIGASQGTILDIQQLGQVAGRVGYVYQDEPLLFGALDDHGDDDIVFDDYSCSFRGPASIESALDPIKVEFLSFFSPDVWRTRASVIDISVGRRFHGNLIVMQAAKPALFILHDDRVRDMAQALGVAALPAEQWVGPKRVELLRSFAASFDTARAEATYSQTLSRFQAGLLQTGLRTTA